MRESFTPIQTGWNGAASESLMNARPFQPEQEAAIEQHLRVPADIAFTDLSKTVFERTAPAVGAADMRDGAKHLLRPETMNLLDILHGKSAEDALQIIQNNIDLFRKLYAANLIIPPGQIHTTQRRLPDGQYSTLQEWINPNRDCTSACVFCFAGQAHPERKEMLKHIPPVMPRSVMELIVKDMPRSAKLIGANHIHLKFGGGGEPALAMGQVSEFLDLIDERLPAEYSYDWTLITSGLGLNDQKLAEIKKRNGYIALSSGGDREGHNLSRPMKGGKGSYDMMTNTLRRIKRMDIPANLTMVFTATNIANAYRFLEEIYNDTEIGWVPIITSVVRDNGSVEGDSFVPTTQALLEGWQNFLNVMLEGAIHFKQPIPPNMDYVEIGPRKEHTCIAGINYITAGATYTSDGEVAPLINSCHVNSSDPNLELIDSNEPFLTHANRRYQPYLQYKTDANTGCKTCGIQGWCGGEHEAGGCAIQKHHRDTIKPPYCDFYTQGTEMLMQAVFLADYYNQFIDLI